MSTAIAEPITAADKAWENKIARLAARKPLQRSVTFVDEEAVQAVDDAQEALGRAEALARKELNAKYSDLKNDKERLTRVEKDLPKNRGVIQKQKIYNAAKAAKTEADIVLTMRGIGSNVYEKLQTEHPPTPAQRKAGQSYNVTRFAPVLVAATCTDPMTPAEAARLIGGEFEILDKDGNGTDKWEAVEEASLTLGEAGLLFTTAVGVNEHARGLLGKD